MLEDSITSSPSKSNKSIHKVRWLRKNKRKKIDESMQNHDNEKEELKPNKILHELYEDSDEQYEDTDNKNNTFIVGRPTAIVQNYKPFEREKSLAMADRIAFQQDKHKTRSAIPETQGFLTCQDLGGAGITKNQDSFMITESELINCCHQAEKVLETSQNNEEELANAKEQSFALYKEELELNNSFLQNLSQCSLIKEPTSPQHELDLVNSILQDFSQSPLTKKQPVTNTSWQYTPEFRLRIKPKKTYSRKFLQRTRINLNNRLASITSEEEDDNSNCSSLSIQEDFAPLEGVSNPGASLTNTSQRLCENLINLTAFFTQNSPTNSLNGDQMPQNSNEQLTMTASQEKLLLSSNIPDLIQDILALRSKGLKFRRNSYDSNDDFYGFSSPKRKSNNDIDLLLKNQHTLDETVLQPQVFKLLEERNMDMRSEVSDCESVEGDLNPPLAINVTENNKKLTDWNEDDYQDVFACIDTDKILLQHNYSKNHSTYLKPTNNVEETVIEFVTPKTPTEIEKDARSSITHDSAKLEQDHSTKFIGFKTASAKPIKVSRDAHIMAAKILSKLPDIPVKSTTKKCDNLLNKGALNKNENIFNNPEDEDDEWNDDCDFFKNFQTPVAINENTSSNLQHHEEIVKEKFSYSNDFPSTSKMAMKANIGFQTAAGKSVAISKKAQASVQKLLKEFNTDITAANFDCDDLSDMKTKIYTKMHKLQTSNSKVINDNKLQCKKDKCDNDNLVKGLENSLMILKNDDVEMFEYENKPQSNETNVIFKNNTEYQANNRNFNNSSKGQEMENKTDADKNLKSNNIDEVRQISLDVSYDKEGSRNSPEIFNNNMGFQTANGKKVKISTKAQQSVEKILKEFKTNNNDNFENDLLILKQKLNQKNINKNPDKLQGIARDVKMTELEPLKTLKSFSLTNKEEVEKHFSENNEDLANMVLSEWPLSNRLNNSNAYKQAHENKVNSKTLSQEESLNTKPQEVYQYQSGDKSYGTKTICDSVKICDMQILKSSNIGFQTAKGNKVAISVKAQHAVDKLLKEFRSDLNENNYEKDLMLMKSNIELKNKELKQVNEYKKLNSTQEEQECANMILSEWPLSPDKNSTPKQLTAKRKLSIDNSDIPSPIETRSPPSKLNKELYTTKSLGTERKLRTPLNLSPIKSIIARKNLLSLTKRRKNKINLVSISNQEDSSYHNEKKTPNVLTEFKATPIKTSISLRNSKPTPATPNLQEFFSNAPQTSTPRMDRLSKSPQTPMDIDFEPITWDTNNEATVNKSSSAINQTTKLSDSSCSNVSFNTSNPSAKERIARLKMYGKAPAVSPILIDTHNNCRPSGLRRTRSMFKKKESN